MSAVLADAFPPGFGMKNRVVVTPLDLAGRRTQSEAAGRVFSRGRLSCGKGYIDVRFDPSDDDEPFGGEAKFRYEGNERWTHIAFDPSGNLRLVCKNFFFIE
jgi:hypothetical protein